MAQNVLDEAERQLAALPDDAIFEMHVSNQLGASAIRDLVQREGYFDITVTYSPKL